MDEAVLRRLDEARSLTNERLRLAPTFQIFQSVCVQVEYVYSVATGMNADRSRLRNVMLGLYAIREFDDSDPELSVALKDVQFVADQMAKGLKVFAKDIAR